MKGGGRLNKRFLTVVAVAAVTVTLTTNVIASPTKSELMNNQSKAQQQQKDTEDKLDSVKKQISSLESQIETYDNQITTLMVQIDSSQKQIDSTQKDINKATADLNKAEEDIKDQQALFNKRMQAIYKSGSESYLSVVLDSKSLGDFISRVESLKKITQYDDKMINDLKTKKEEINKKEQDLKNKQDKLVSLKNGQVASKNNLVQKQNEEKKLVVQYQSQQKDLEVKLTASKDDVEKASTALSDFIKAQDNPSTTTTGNNKGSVPLPNGNDKGDEIGVKIASYALSFQGVPYVWGGTTPKGFDCSGLTQYAYAHYGITLNRVAEDQARQGTRLSRSQLQVGDLCFFMNSTGYIHHVAIYIGGGMYVHAPHPGDVVKVSYLDGTDFCFGARVR